MSTITIEQIRTRIESLFAAFNAHDVEALMANFTDDVVWEDPMEPAPLVGREAAERLVRAEFSALPDIHFPKEEVEIYRSLDGQHAASRWHMVATMTGRMDPPGFEPTGRTADVAGTCTYEFRDGLISRHTMHYDTMSFARKLGLMPASDSVAYKAMVGAQVVGKKVTGIFRR